MLDKESDNARHAGTSKYMKNNSSSRCKNNNSSIRYYSTNQNAQSDNPLTREATLGTVSEVPAPNEVSWTNRKKFFVGLLALGVLGFLAFFLVGTMASLKWFDRTNQEPKAIKLGEYAIKEKPAKQQILAVPTPAVVSESSKNVTLSEPRSARYHKADRGLEAEKLAAALRRKSNGTDTTSLNQIVPPLSSELIFNDSWNATPVNLPENRTAGQSDAYPGATRNEAIVDVQDIKDWGKATSGSFVEEHAEESKGYETNVSFSDAGLHQTTMGVPSQRTSSYPNFNDLKPNLGFNLTEMSVSELNALLNQLSSNLTGTRYHKADQGLKAEKNVAALQKKNYDTEITSLNQSNIPPLLIFNDTEYATAVNLSENRTAEQSDAYPSVSRNQMIVDVRGMKDRGKATRDSFVKEYAEEANGFGTTASFSDAGLHQTTMGVPAQRVSHYPNFVDLKPNLDFNLTEMSVSELKTHLYQLSSNLTGTF